MAANFNRNRVGLSNLMQRFGQIVSPIAGRQPIGLQPIMPPGSAIANSAPILGAPVATTSPQRLPGVPIGLGPLATQEQVKAASGAANGSAGVVPLVPGAGTIGPSSQAPPQATVPNMASTQPGLSPVVQRSAQEGSGPGFGPDPGEVKHAPAILLNLPDDQTSALASQLAQMRAANAWLRNMPGYVELPGGAHYFQNGTGPGAGGYPPGGQPPDVGIRQDNYGSAYAGGARAQRLGQLLARAARFNNAR